MEDKLYTPKYKYCITRDMQIGTRIQNTYNIIWMDYNGIVPIKWPHTQNDNDKEVSKNECNYNVLLKKNAYNIRVEECATVAPVSNAGRAVLRPRWPNRNSNRMPPKATRPLKRQVRGSSDAGPLNPLGIVHQQPKSMAYHWCHLPLQSTLSTPHMAKSHPLIDRSPTGHPKGAIARQA